MIPATIAPFSQLCDVNSSLTAEVKIHLIPAMIAPDFANLRCQQLVGSKVKIQELTEQTQRCCVYQFVNFVDIFFKLPRNLKLGLPKYQPFSIAGKPAVLAKDLDAFNRNPTFSVPTGPSNPVHYPEVVYDAK